MKTDSSSSGLAQILRGNGTVVDRSVVILSAVLSVTVFIIYVLMRTQALRPIGPSYGIYILVDEILLTAVIALYWFVKGDMKWPRYFFIGAMMFTVLVISTVVSLSYLIFALPIMMVTSYYDRRFTLAIAAVGLVLMCMEPFVSSYLGTLDLNYCELEVYSDNTIYIRSTPMEEATRKFVAMTIPSVAIYVSMIALSLWVTTRGLSLVKERADLVKSQTSLKNELAIASDIQLGMLPADIPETDSYYIQATMKPAKDVGGDFYDVIHVGISHIAFLVADVSGKGVPAALFMASTRTLIRNNLENGLSVDMVMDRTNSELLKTNKEKLFVTAWLGILDLTSGTLSYVNAGHNPPFLIHANDTVAPIQSKPNFILGRRKGIRYKEHRINLSSGDRIFLYTDGLTDSMNTEGERFSEARVKGILECGMKSGEIIPNMMESVHTFSQDTVQFDDITMLLVEYKGPKKIQYSEGEEFPASPDGHNSALAYIESRLHECGCTEKVITDMKISASEILSNIDMYAYQDVSDGTVRISADVIDRVATVIFKDRGPEYNPLGRSNPDMEKRIKEHKIGGFGIFIVNKLMDDVRYERTDDMNVLTIMKEV
jgi:sigma-B regulation protein RsbU (phosphoserine phosphatase)